MFAHSGARIRAKENVGMLAEPLVRTVRDNDG